MKFSLHVPLFFCLLVLLCPAMNAQNYHAYNGSPYSGVFGLYNNPASTANSPFKWDVNLFSLQGFLANGILHVEGLSKDTVKFGVTEGTANRYIHGVANAELLNFRFNLNKKTAIAFALRGRSYNHAKTAAFTWSDTVNTLNSFLHANTNVQYLQAFTVHDSWLEADFNVSHVLYTDMNNRFSAGITMGYMQNLSGAFASINKVTYTEQATSSGGYSQVFNGGGLSATYSANYDLAANNGNSAKTFLKNTLSSINFSIGAEWLFKMPNIYEDEPVTNINYDWKFGASIMDIGKNLFTPADYSFTAGIPKTNNISNTDIDKRFNNVGSLKRLRDSVNVTFANVEDITGQFAINMPTRLLLSADRNFGNHFFANAQLNINFYSTEPRGKINTRELNGLTLTPRWEKKQIGFYMPVQYTTQGKLLIGAAAKLGPLLIGVHNVGWLFGGKSLDRLNGGGYIAIHIKSSEKTEKTRMDCAADIR